MLMPISRTGTCEWSRLHLSWLLGANSFAFLPMVALTALGTISTYSYTARKNVFWLVLNYEFHQVKKRNPNC